MAKYNGLSKNKKIIQKKHDDCIKKFETCEQEDIKCRNEIKHVAKSIV